MKNIVPKSFWLILTLCAAAWAQETPAEKPVAELLNPAQLKETFIYWGRDLVVIVPDESDSRKVIRAFHTPLNPNPENQHNYDNDVLDWKTLRPLEKQTAAGAIYYDYSRPGEVGLRFVTPKETVTRTVKIDRPNYNLRGPGAGVLAASLPLRPGFRTKFSEIRFDFPYIAAYDSKIIDYVLEVVGEEKVALGGQVFETYVVEIDSTAADAGVYYKMWVTKTAPHHAVKFIYTGKNGKPDYKTRRPFTVSGFFVSGGK